MDQKLHSKNNIMIFVQHFCGVLQLGKKKNYFAFVPKKGKDF